MCKTFWKCQVCVPLESQQKEKRHWCKKFKKYFRNLASQFLVNGETAVV
jgi:hypothetical protein